MTQSPLDIPELLETCIGHLCASGSSRDLLSCSLVARSWVNAAQSNLLRVPMDATPERSLLLRAPGLCRALKKFPHLLRHIRELDLESYDASLAPEVIEQLSHLAFTHLKSIYIRVHGESSPEALHRLVHLPRLRYLGLRAVLDGSYDLALTMLVQALRHSSPSVEHLDLHVVDFPNKPIGDEVAAPILLKSARLVWGPEREHYPTRISSVYPFNISELKALCTVAGTFVPWHTIPKQSIQILQLECWNDPDFCDISVFPNLLVLRLEVHVFSKGLITTLASISSEQKIHTIVIIDEYNYVDETERKELDLELVDCCSRLPHLRTIDVEAEYATGDEIGSSFPLLSCRKMFRNTSPSWERHNVLSWRDLVMNL
ncbi:hypothetical protein R3P38DRAFT_2951150 [Favolaschia claudopus]|uniref:F-box domain-containing protein n=1 Tax=Favolaschia claudopus TaxID=2862362 RepID=A0AAW0BEZ5_9AGAR